MDFSGILKVIYVITHLHSSPAPLPKYIPQEVVESYMKKTLQKYPAQIREILEEDDYFTALAHMAIYHAAEQAQDRETLNYGTKRRNRALCEQGWQKAMRIRCAAARGDLPCDINYMQDKKIVPIVYAPRFSGIVQEMRADKTLKYTHSEFWNKRY